MVTESNALQRRAAVTAPGGRERNAVASDGHRTDGTAGATVARCYVFRIPNMKIAETELRELASVLSRTVAERHVTHDIAERRGASTTVQTHGDVATVHITADHGIGREVSQQIDVNISALRRLASAARAEAIAREGDRLAVVCAEACEIDDPSPYVEPSRRVIEAIVTGMWN